MATQNVYTPSPIPIFIGLRGDPVILEEDEEESQFTSRHMGRNMGFVKTSKKEFVEGQMNFSDAVKKYLESKERWSCQAPCHELNYVKLKDVSELATLMSRNSQ